MTNRVTIDDVATRANVSPRTVSRVINNLPNVSQKSRIAIENAIAELNFHPNFAARALASSRSFFIGIFSPAVSSSYFLEMTATLVAACRKRGYHPVIEQLSTENGDIAEQVGRAMREVRFAGIIVLSIPPDQFGISEKASAAEIPLISISHFVSALGEASISVDVVEAETLLADHLWALGHRRFGVPIMEQMSNFNRGEHFIDRLLALGCTIADIVRYPINWRVPALDVGANLAAAVVAQGDMPTALFALSDDVAASAISHFLTAGIQVPGDISVAGFDDTQLARSIWPQLTTINQPVEAMADAAVDWLLDENRHMGGGPQTMPVKLVVRASTGPARKILP